MEIQPLRKGSVRRFSNTPERLKCKRCEKRIKIGEPTVQKYSNGKAVYYHESCFEELLN